MEGQDKKTMGGRAGTTVGPLLKSSTKESIMTSITTTTEEMVTIATLKEAIANWLKLDDFADYYEEGHSLTGFCLLLGQLEMSLIRRKQSLDEDRKALSEVPNE